jgi:hypothetical protein
MFHISDYIKLLEDIPEGFKPFKGNWWIKKSDNIIEVYKGIDIKFIDQELLEKGDDNV